LSSGAEDQISLNWNREGFSSIKLLPRVLVNVSKLDTSLEVLGVPIDFPVLIAATAMHKMADPEGEIATARAASASGTIMCLSSLSTTGIEEVSKASRGPKWLQLYVLKRRELTEKLVMQAEAYGYSALVLTVDTPLLGKRENDIRNGFHLSEGLKLEIYRSIESNELPEGLNAYIAQQMDSSLTWKDLAWLKSITKLPILLKGIHSPKDAELALKYGVAGIIVSNHGARQLDTVPSTIEMLPDVVEAVKGRIPVFIDGGIRRGTDVLKALALGAKAVFIGRPVLWGLSCSGEQGVTHVLKILKEEFKLAMALCGCSTVANITRDLIFHAPGAQMGSHITARL